MYHKLLSYAEDDLIRMEPLPIMLYTQHLLSLLHQ